MFQNIWEGDFLLTVGIEMGECRGKPMSPGTGLGVGEVLGNENEH